MRTLISLVVPVYNEAAIIRANLEKILSAIVGNEYNVECIVIDDGIC
jgi:glycosyltransferase involved in cell wall biosynthesis